MIDIRIVCAHDAVKLAEMLTRLLEAEQHRVRLSFGRQALSELEDARTSHDAVLLIWSPNARTQTYMLEWAGSIDPHRLVEIARGGDGPPIRRLGAVIDFGQWRGERGARAWNALNDRLRAVARVLDPPKPPPRQALIGLGLASAAAIAGAVVVRVNDAPQAPIATPTEMDAIAAIDPDLGVGGPLTALEPASLADDDPLLLLLHDAEPIDTAPAPPLAETPDVLDLQLRDPTLVERLAALNPLRRQTVQGSQ